MNILHPVTLRFRKNVKDDLLIFNNNNDEEFEKSMKEITGILNETINQD